MMMIRSIYIKYIGSCVSNTDDIVNYLLLWQSFCRPHILRGITPKIFHYIHYIDNQMKRDGINVAYNC